MKPRFSKVTGGAAVIVLGVTFLLYSPQYFPSDLPLTTTDTEASAVAVSFTPLMQGTQSKVTRQVNYLITSSDALHELWEMVDATTTLPKIDFKTHAVVAVFAGEQPTTGYKIAVAEIEDSSARHVSITLTKPDSTCMVGQALTTPYEIVVVPTTSLPLTHEDNAITTDCP